MAQTSALLAYLEDPCLMPAGFQRSSATERQPKRQRATEQPSLVNMPLHWTDEFWLEEAKDFTSQDASLAGGHHPRRPDLAMKICIYMKTKKRLGLASVLWRLPRTWPIKNSLSPYWTRFAAECSTKSSTEERHGTRSLLCCL